MFQVSNKHWKVAILISVLFLSVTKTAKHFWIWEEILKVCVALCSVTQGISSAFLYIAKIATHFGFEYQFLKFCVVFCNATHGELNPDSYYNISTSIKLRIVKMDNWLEPQQVPLLGHDLWSICIHTKIKPFVKTNTYSCTSEFLLPEDLLPLLLATCLVTSSGITSALISLVLFFDSITFRGCTFLVSFLVLGVVITTLLGIVCLRRLGCNLCKGSKVKKYCQALCNFLKLILQLSKDYLKL